MRANEEPIGDMQALDQHSVLANLDVGANMYVRIYERATADLAAITDDRILAHLA